MTRLEELRARLRDAETVRDAHRIRVSEARRVLAAAEADEYDARVLVSELRLELDELVGREDDRDDARRWREHVASCASKGEAAA